MEQKPEVAVVASARPRYDYVVEFPDPTTPGKICSATFGGPKEAGDFLGISPDQVTRAANGELKCKQRDTKKLQNVKITKVPKQARAPRAPGEMPIDEESAKYLNDLATRLASLPIGR